MRGGHTAQLSGWSSRKVHIGLTLGVTCAVIHVLRAVPHLRYSLLLSDTSSLPRAKLDSSLLCRLELLLFCMQLRSCLAVIRLDMLGLGYLIAADVPSIDHVHA